MKEFESIIADFEAADRAGVFARTPQPHVSAGVAHSGQAKIFMVSPKWAIAAAFVMAMGVWTVMFRMNLSDLQNRGRITRLSTAIDMQTALASCVGGPSGALNQVCGRVDFDGDGDADLRDIGAYQRDLTGASH